MPAKLSDFNYDLPKELIAQDALPNRGEARLLVQKRDSGEIIHDHFYNCLNYFNRGDVLVLNNTKVLPARLFAKKETGGRVEILLLRKSRHCERPQGAKQSQKIADCFVGLRPPRNDGGENWQALLKPGGRIKAGERLLFEETNKISSFAARVIDSSAENSGIRHLQFEKGIDVRQLMESAGRIPLPPYIDREDSPVDRELYQTVFASVPGAVASPTAGLHFDVKLLNAIEAKGIEIVYATLHVSYGTFQPVAVEDLTKHRMHAEYFNLPEESAEKINMAKMDGRRVIACGTTSLRMLEAAAVDRVPPEVEPKQGWTNLFIFPPFEFKIADAIITNFHLPKTTLLMLAAAFCGKENLDRAYREAIERKYRFYSYGDAMLII